jgi:hypothetical protein
LCYTLGTWERETNPKITKNLTIDPNRGSKFEIAT